MPCIALLWPPVAWPLQNSLNVNHLIQKVIKVVMFSLFWNYSKRLFKIRKFFQSFSLLFDYFILFQLQNNDEANNSNLGCDSNICCALGDWMKSRNTIASDMGGTGTEYLECYCYTILFRICVSHIGADWICNLEFVIGIVAFHSKW